MAEFLVDVNLPYYFSLWRNERYMFQHDRNSSASDSEVWNFAREQNLTIITKDSDFSYRMMLHEPPPKVIHIRCGNVSMRDFFALILRVWDQMMAMNKDHKLVVVYRDRIEGIS
jgi:predicted nuclease of predicted toxin-antitoxin system